jgi:hypothetical protein
MSTKIEQPLEITRGEEAHSSELIPWMICMVMHNRLSDTNREYACSKGLATVLPMDYATQTLTVANALPRLPKDLDIWQFMAKGKDRVFEVSVRITTDVRTCNPYR